MRIFGHITGANLRWEFPDLQRILPEQQLAVRIGIEVKMLVDKLELLVHRQLPTRTRIAGTPDQLLPAELFISRLEKRMRVLRYEDAERRNSE